MPTTSLNMIAFHITDNCSAHCPMCYENANRNPDLDGEFETLKKVVHNAIASGRVENFLMVGGDPCEHPHLIELMQYIKDEGAKYGVNTFIEVLSNTHVYRKNGVIVPMSEVAKLVDKMNVTLHGETPEIHDAFNGSKGSYNRVMAQLKEFARIKNENQSIGVTVNVMPYTLHSIAQMVYNANLILDGAIEDVCVQRIAPVGRAKGQPQFLIEKQDVDVLMPLLADLDSKGFGLDICDCFPYCAVKPEFRHLLPKGGCNWGTEVISVKPNGEMTRCALSTNVVGDITTLDSEEKWVEWFEHSPELHAFREKCHLTEACKNCENVINCGGGCLMARPQDPYAEDPAHPKQDNDRLATPPTSPEKGL